MTILQKIQRRAVGLVLVGLVVVGLVLLWGVRE